MIEFKVDNLINMNSALQDFLDFLVRENVAEEDVFDSRLVSCELITNVIRHLGETAYFSGGLTENVIEIQVRSEKSGGAVVIPTLPDVFAESGRGLYIVNTICGGDIKVVGNRIEVRIRRRPDGVEKKE